jgi:hypothetical protein
MKKPNKARHMQCHTNLNKTPISADTKRFFQNYPRRNINDRRDVRRGCYFLPPPPWSMYVTIQVNGYCLPQSL